MEEAIAIIIAIIVILISNWRISKWKKEAATAYFIIGQKATSSEEREWAYRKAFKYGHTKAKLFYIYAAANTFSGRKPLTPFTITSDKGEIPIVAIFYDYYIRAKHLPYASDIQQEITQRVLELKMVSTPHQIYTQKFCEHLKPISTRIGKLHKDQPSSLCPAAANNHITTVSQLSQEASPKDITTIPLSMQYNTPIHAKAIWDKKDQKCSYPHRRNVPTMFLSASKNKSKILLDFIK